MILEGRVVKITPRSICAVVLGFPSVFCLMKTFARTSSIKYSDQEALHITGSMVAKHTGCARWVDRNVDEWSQARSTKKKRKSGNQNVENPNNESLTTNENIFSKK